MPRPTPADLLHEIQTNAAGLSWPVSVDEVTTNERIEAIWAPPFGDDSLVRDALNAPNHGARPVRVPWIEIWRYLDTQTTPSDGPIPSAPIRYALTRYATVLGQNADPATAAACWMAEENWKHPTYPDVDVHDASFTAFAQALVSGELIAVAQVEHIVDTMGTVPSSRAEELWGAGTVITLDDLIAARAAEA